MTKNYELLDETLAYIEDNPEDWDQNHWVAPCGTALCFAGNAALIAHPDYMLEVDANDRRLLTQCLLDANRRWVGPIRFVAEQDLGLTLQESSQLFSGGNSLTRIRNLIARWKRRDGVDG